MNMFIGCIVSVRPIASEARKIGKNTTNCAQKLAIDTSLFVYYKS